MTETQTKRIKTAWGLSNGEVYGRCDDIELPKTLKVYERKVLERVFSREEIYKNYQDSKIESPQEFWTGFWTNHWAAAVLSRGPCQFDVMLGSVFTEGARRLVWKQKLAYDTKTKAMAVHLQLLFKVAQSRAAVGAMWPETETWGHFQNDGETEIVVTADGYGGGHVIHKEPLGMLEYLNLLTEYYPVLGDAEDRAAELADIDFDEDEDS